MLNRATHVGDLFGRDSKPGAQNGTLENGTKNPNLPLADGPKDLRVLLVLGDVWRNGILVVLKTRLACLGKAMDPWVRPF